MPNLFPVKTLFVQDPTVALQVANKQYVDSQAAAFFARNIISVDQIISNSTTLANLTEMASISLGAVAAVISFEMTLLYLSTAVADIKTRFQISGAGTGIMNSNTDFNITAMATTNMESTRVDGADGSTQMGFMKGVINTVGGETLTYQFAQNVAEVSNTTILAGTNLLLQRVIP